MGTNSWSDRDTEAVLSGRRPEHEDLVPLAQVFDALRGEAAQEPDASLVASFASELAAAAASASGAVVVAKTSRRSPIVRRVSLAGLAALALGVGVAGAAAANGSAPGDPLYGVDRAMERVGINDGGLRERVAESLKLEGEGETDEAIAHLSDSLEADGHSEAAASLVSAAERIQSNGSANSAAVHAAVADMLLWMATTDLTGRAFGQGVAEHAHEIGAGHGPTSAAQGPGGADQGAQGEDADAAKPHPSNGPDANAPGPTNTHKPENSVKPEKPGKPTTPGAHDAQGSSNGKSSDRGKP